MATSSKEKLIAIGRQALRLAFKQAGDGVFIHMVPAWPSAKRVVLGQVKAEENSNDITAIPALLDLLDVKSTLFTIDATGTQTAIAQKIVDKGGDYLLAVKGNPPTLHDAIIWRFGVGTSYNECTVAETHEHAHGWEETRRVDVSPHWRHRQRRTVAQARHVDSRRVYPHRQR